MKILPALLLITGPILLSPVARGINPTMDLETFGKERGFSSLLACQDEKEGTTCFQITVNPAVFLSHFRHGFPRDRETSVMITLRSLNDEHFKGVTVEFGSVSSKDPERPIGFTIPTTDLNRYRLEFQCYIPSAEEELPIIIGGELYLAPLKSIREAKETITETSPIYKEQEEVLRKLAPAPTPSGAPSFGGGLNPREGAIMTPAPDK